MASQEIRDKAGKIIDVGVGSTSVARDALVAAAKIPPALQGPLRVVPVIGTSFGVAVDV